MTSYHKLRYLTYDKLSQVMCVGAGYVCGVCGCVVCGVCVCVCGERGVEGEG